MMRRVLAAALAAALLLLPVSGDAWLVQGKITSYPAFVNVGTAVTVGSAASSMTIPLPGSLVAGNVLIATTTIRDTRSPTWPAGWTAIGAGHTATHVVDGTEVSGPAVTFTAGANQAGIMAQYSDNNYGVGATSDNQAQTGSPATTASVNTTADRSLCVAAIMSGVFTTVPSTPSGYSNDAGTNIGSSASYRFASAQVANSGSACGAVSSTVSASGLWRAALVEMKTH